MNQPVTNFSGVERQTGAQPEWAVIWLHGLGADGHDFEPIVPELVRPGWPALRFVFPHAPVQPVTINNGMAMRAWYDIASFDPNAPQDDAGIRASVARVEALIARENARGIPAERIVLAGFSQGGAIVMRAAVDSQLPLAGVMALSTYGPSLEEALQQHQGPRLDVFFAHGEHDDILHPQLGRQAHDLLAAAGHTTRWHAYPMAHEVCPQEISDIRQWLTGRLGLR